MVSTRQDLYNIGITSESQLKAINNQQGYRRCHGKIYTNQHGFARITRCNRWHCWLCGIERVESTRQSIELMTASALHRVFITWRVDAQLNDFPSQRKYIALFKAWINRWRDVLRKRGEVLSYIAVHSVDDNGILHTHVTASHGIGIGGGVLYCEPIQNPHAVAVYMAKNLKDSIHHDYYEGWRYTTSSRDVPKTRLPEPSKPHRLDVQWHHTTHTTTIIISILLLLDAVKIGWRVNRCSRCKRVMESHAHTRCDGCRQHDKIRHHQQAIINHVMESAM